MSYTNFYYSKKQAVEIRKIESNNDEPNHRAYIDGKEFTEKKDGISNWSDAILIKQIKQNDKKPNITYNTHH